jgi:PAS domain S-box-containing protein
MNHSALVTAADSLTSEISDWQSLHALSSRLLHLSCFADQVKEVLRTVADFHGSTHGVISLFSDKAGGLVPVASLGLSDEGLKQLRCIAIGEGACGLAFQEKRRIIIADTETDPIYSKYVCFARDEGIRSVLSTPFYDATGKTLGVLSIYARTPKVPDERELRLTDICTAQVALLVEREQSQKALRDEQERSHQVLSSIKDGFILMDREFRVQQINAEGLRLDGRAVHEIVGRSHWELWADSETLPVGQAYKQAMHERVPVSLEQCYTHFGQEIWLDIQAYPSGDGLAVFYRDISARKNAERALREREEQLRLAIDAADVGLWDVDVVANTLFWPARVKGMFGISADRPVSMDDFYSGLHPDDFARTSAAFADAADPQLRALYDVEYRTIGKEDNVVRWVAAKGRGIFNDAGRCVRMIGTAIDITKRKASDEALRDSEERLRQSDRRKDEFLAMLAHELRNPLAPISAAAELIGMVKLDEARLQGASRIISRQVHHLTELVDDLLDVSRVTRGLITLNKTKQDIKDVVASAAEQVRPLMEAQHHHFSMDLSPQAANVVGDKKRLVQIVANLLNNAAKYTPEHGSICLKLEVDEERVLVHVQDNGIGIAPELQPHIFKLFAQAERTADRTQGGLGLGLALVKNLVELHDGSVSCQSNGLGEGSCFTVSFPRLTVETHTGAAQPWDGTTLRTLERKLRILVVDDNLDAADMLKMLLEALGHDVLVENESRSALIRAQTELPDLVLLDIGLPNIDGYALARQLRESPSTSHLKLAAVTGYGQESDRKKAWDAGFDYHLVKPVDSKKLMAILVQCTRPSMPPSG